MTENIKLAYEKQKVILIAGVAGAGIGGNGGQGRSPSDCLPDCWCPRQRVSISLGNPPADKAGEDICTNPTGMG
ncbi:MAG: hypothetical protein Kow0088_11980 [Anaerolineales bacterium]